MRVSHMSAHHQMTDGMRITNINMTTRKKVVRDQMPMHLVYHDMIHIYYSISSVLASIM